jgi:cytochrome c556
MLSKLLLSLVAAAGVLSALPASAQFQKPEDAIKYRKAAFTVMGAHFGRIGAMVNNRVPFDAKAAAENADIVAEMAKLPFAGFGPGTDKGDTRAKPEIWTEMDKFRGGATKLQEESVKLAAAAKVGTPEALKAAFGEAAKTCKACHDSYRKE